MIANYTTQEIYHVTIYRGFDVFCLRHNGAYIIARNQRQYGIACETLSSALMSIDLYRVEWLKREGH